MSRYEITGDDPNMRITVGWDRPLSTYFAQVISPEADEESEDYILLWIGCRPYEIATPEALIKPLARYVTPSETILQCLRADRILDLDRGPTATQRMLLDLLDEGREGQHQAAVPTTAAAIESARYPTTREADGDRRAMHETWRDEAPRTNAPSDRHLRITPFVLLSALAIDLALLFACWRFL